LYYAVVGVQVSDVLFFKNSAPTICTNELLKTIGKLAKCSSVFLQYKGDYSFLSPKEMNNRTSSQQTMLVVMQLAKKLLSTMYSIVNILW